MSMLMSYLGELEFSKIFLASIQFALFKTYGIPTISELLVATKEFSTPENASKRYADTGILIGEFTFHHPQSDRVIKALARMNYIHTGTKMPWKSIGDAMGIKYDGRLSDTEWTDGLQFYEDIKACAFDYEEKYMIPAKSNW
ncbi:hypothetical protein V1515DRAFT_582326 [Lipomyces mesembrius]